MIEICANERTCKPAKPSKPSSIVSFQKRVRYPSNNGVFPGINIQTTDNRRETDGNRKYEKIKINKSF